MVRLLNQFVFGMMVVADAVIVVVAMVILFWVRFDFAIDLIRNNVIVGLVLVMILSVICPVFEADVSNDTLIVVVFVLPAMILSVSHAVVETDVLNGSAIVVVVVVVVFSALVLLLIEFAFEAVVFGSIAIDVVVVTLYVEIVAAEIDPIVRFALAVVVVNDLYFHQLVMR
jgi:hypothetical protein